eukprot:5028782-Lingulodinium_polyedra.AAC.1
MANALEERSFRAGAASVYVPPVPEAPYVIDFMPVLRGTGKRNYWPRRGRVFARHHSQLRRR